MNPNNYQNYLNTNGGPSAIPTPAANQPNGFEKLLPTAGGIIGGIVGDALPGGPLTGIAGAAGGDALGKFIEDKMTGQGGGNGVLGSAIQGGLGQGVGYGISALGGAALRGASGLLGRAAEGNAAKAATDQAATDAANAAADKQAIYGEAVKAAKDPSIGNTFQSTLDNAEKTYGINTLDPNAPKLMSEVGHAQTGGNIENGQGALNETVDRIINENPGKVNLGGINDELTNSVGDLNTKGIGGTLDQMVGKGKQLVPANNPAQKAVQDIAELSPKLSTAGGTALSASEMTSTEADGLAKSLQKLAFSPVKVSAEGLQDPAAVAKQKIAQDLYSYVRGEVDRQPGFDETVKGIRDDPELEAFVDKKVAGISDPAVQAATKAKLLNTFQNANSIQDLRSAQADAVALSKLGDHVSNFNGERTYTSGAANREPVNLKQNAPAPSQNPTLLDAASVLTAGPTHGMSLIPAVAAHTVNAAKNPAVVDTAAKGLSKLVGSKTAKTLVPALIKSGAIAAANLPNDMSGPAGSAIPVPGAAQASNMGGAMNPTQQYYQTLLSQLQAQPADPQTGALLGALNGVVPTVQKQAFAAPVIAGTESAFGNAGGAQGPIAGGLTALTSAIPGSPANTYQTQQASAAAALGSLLGISPEAAMSLLPGLMQTAQSAQARTGALSGITGGIPQSAIPVAAGQ